MTDVFTVWQSGLLSDTEALLRLASTEGTYVEQTAALEQIRAIALEMDKRENERRVKAFKTFLETKGVEDTRNRTAIIESLVILFAANQILWHPGDETFILGAFS